MKEPAFFRAGWQEGFCPELDEIVPDTGVCALVDGEQVAVFRWG